MRSRPVSPQFCLLAGLVTLSLISLSLATADDTPRHLGRVLDIEFIDLLSSTVVATVDPESDRFGTLVVFWSTQCGPCLSEIPVINELYAEWKPLGLEIIGIPQDRRSEVIIGTCREFEVSWPQYLEPGPPFEKPTTAAFGVLWTPWFMLLDAKGRVVLYAHEDPAEGLVELARSGSE